MADHCLNSRDGLRRWSRRLEPDNRARVYIVEDRSVFRAIGVQDLRRCMISGLFEISETHKHLRSSNEPRDAREELMIDTWCRSRRAFLVSGVLAALACA